MDTWTSIPCSGAKIVIDGLNRTALIREKTFEELYEWRDNRLIELLKILYKQEYHKCFFEI